MKKIELHCCIVFASCAVMASKGPSSHARTPRAHIQQVECAICGSYSGHLYERLDGTLTLTNSFCERCVCVFAIGT